jgi:prevent-host-death family protein
MQTITAKELRDNMDSVVRRVRAGERIRVTYRSKPAFTLEPQRADAKTKSALKKPEPGSPEAMQQFLQSVASHRRHIKKSVFDPNKSIKELYHEMLDNDPKYKPPYHR